MVVRRSMAVWIVVFAMLVGSSCSSPKYLIKELTLPPGSSEVSLDTDSKGISSNPYLNNLGKIRKSVVVGFDCNSGWDSVSAHIDSCMQRAGYESTGSQLSKMPGVGIVADKLGDFNNMMRMYTRMGGRYQVMLMNNNWIGDKTGVTSLNREGADFTLYVIEYEGD